jgi:S-adenosylmethionine:tRNA ribosyltransferase-isomerase
MHTQDFNYELPPEFIAQTAAEPRDSSRLMVLGRHDGHIEHRIFRDLPNYLRPGDALVLNQTRVIPARLHGVKASTGGAIEVFLLERIDDLHWSAFVGGKRMVAGVRIIIQRGDYPPIGAEIVEVRDGAERVIAFDTPIEPHLEALGETPLPPYIHEKLPDPERYQTVYARRPGSVAAPTAGLHFTPELLVNIQAMGVALIYVTLHVGAGTFQPVRAEQIEAHRLHAEYAELRPDEAKRINDIKLAGGRIFAVGTTSVRTLETAAARSAGEAGLDACPWRPVVSIAEQTTLFIRPGDPFRVVDGMITNFHLPQSTLLMLVSAFAGRESILNAYETAKQEKYRFYSLGDAMLIL